MCYLCICDKSYPRKLAFSYLEELSKEFYLSYGNEVEKVGLRPYAFVKFGMWDAVHGYHHIYFAHGVLRKEELGRYNTTNNVQWCLHLDTFMQKTKRLYQDTRTQHNLTKLNEDLQDVTRIMTKNMEDLLWRGDSLDRMFPLFHYMIKPRLGWVLAYEVVRKPICGQGYLLKILISFHMSTLSKQAWTTSPTSSKIAPSTSGNKRIIWICRRYTASTVYRRPSC